jgi:Putative Ig domain
VTLTGSAKSGSVGGTPSSEPSGNAVSSLVCSPSAVTAGGAVTCELFVTARSQSESVELNSSSEQVLIPAVVTTRPNQSSLTFQAQSNPVSKQEPVTITATLGTAEVEDTILPMVSSGPVLMVPKGQTAKAGVPTSFKVSAVDLSDPPLQLEGAKIPGGASFDPLTGVFDWTPQASQAGKYRITFTATNSARQSSTAEVELEVGSGLPTLNTPAPSCSPGATATLTGKWLAAPGSQFSDPTGASFDLDGTSVTVNGQAVPVLYGSADRVDFLCPTVELKLSCRSRLRPPSAPANP